MLAMQEGGVIIGTSRSEEASEGAAASDSGRASDTPYLFAPLQTVFGWDTPSESPSGASPVGGSEEKPSSQGSSSPVTSVRLKPERELQHLGKPCFSSASLPLHCSRRACPNAVSISQNLS